MMRMRLKIDGEKIKAYLKDTSFQVGFQAGFFLGASIYIVFGISYGLIFLLDTFCDAFFIIMHTVGWVFMSIAGLPADSKNRLIRVLEISKDPSEMESEYEQVDGLNEWCFDLFSSVSYIGRSIGEKFYVLFQTNFPVLQDIELDLNFINFNLFNVLKTFFNILQFVVILYLMLKLKRKLRLWVRAKIGRDKGDYFDEQYFNPVI